MSSLPGLGARTPTLCGTEFDNSSSPATEIPETWTQISFADYAPFQTAPTPEAPPRSPYPEESLPSPPPSPPPIQSSYKGTHSSRDPWRKQQLAARYYDAPIDLPDGTSPQGAFHGRAINNISNQTSSPGSYCSVLTRKDGELGESFSRRTGVIPQTQTQGLPQKNQSGEPFGYSYDARGVYNPAFSKNSTTHCSSKDKIRY